MRCRNFKNNKWKYRNIVFQENYAIKKYQIEQKKSQTLFKQLCFFLTQANILTGQN